MPGCAGCRCTAGLHPEITGGVFWVQISENRSGPCIFWGFGMQSIHDKFVGLSCCWHFESNVWPGCLMPFLAGRRTASCTKYLKASDVGLYSSMPRVHEIAHSKIIIALSETHCHKRWLQWFHIRLSSPGVVQSFGYLLRQKWRVDYTSPTWCWHFQSNGHRWYWVKMDENGWKWQFSRHCHLPQNPPLQYYKTVFLTLKA